MSFNTTCVIKIILNNFSCFLSYGKSTTYSCTFLDDILCVVCGSAMGKIAHSHGLEEEEKRNLPKNLELLSKF